MSRTKIDRIVSSPTIIFEIVFSAGKREPSRRSSSISWRSSATGSGAASIRSRRSSCSARPSGGTTRPRSGRVSASDADQPNSRSAAAFQAITIPSRSVAVNASGALSRISRKRDSLWLSARAWSEARMASARTRPTRRETRNPATAGVTTASSQRTAGLGGSWAPSRTAYATPIQATWTSA